MESGSKSKKIFPILAGKPPLALQLPNDLLRQPPGHVNSLPRTPPSGFFILFPLLKLLHLNTALGTFVIQAINRALKHVPKEV